MNPNIENIAEPTAIGTRVIDRNFGNHEWYLGEEGWWHCECDGSSIDWHWSEVVAEIGANSNNYAVVAPE